MIRRCVLARACAGAIFVALGLAATASAVCAQAWPSRPVTLVVPYGPGASNDIFTRAIAAYLSKKFGQPFVVENRPGAGGFTGASAVTKANPDGYTLLEMMVLPFKETMKVDFDQRTDLDTVAVFAKSSSALIIPASLPVKTVDEFVAYAKRNAQPMFYGHTSKGDPGQLNAELFAKLSGINVKEVVYKSAAEVNTDLIANRVQIHFVSVASVIGNIKSGQLRLLAYVSKNEADGAPAAPTFEQAGVKGMDKSQLWWTIFAPKGTPREIVKKFNEAVNEAIKEPAIVELFAKSAVAPAHYSAEESTAIVKKELDGVGDIIKETSLKFDE